MLSSRPFSVQFLKKINLFYLFIFGCIGSFVAARGLSLAVVSRVYSSSWCAGSLLLAVASLVPRAQALGVRASAAVARGLSSCGAQALECRLSSCGARA